MKKITKFFNRLPIAYYIRFALLSENAEIGSSRDLACFNNCNSISSVPQLFFEVNEKIKVNSAAGEYDKAIQIATYLRLHFKGGRGLGLSSRKTLEKMIAEEGGVCSDFSQIFNYFCLINDIKVREWGCIDKIYKPKYGHTFSEIYSSGKQKWIAIDVHKGIVFTDKDDNLLSAIELFSTLRAGESVEFLHYSEYTSPDLVRTPKVYAANTIPFLVCNDRNEEAEQYFEKYQETLTPILINILILLGRKNQKFLFVMDNFKNILLPKFKKKTFSG